ncbi:hypothetical protein [Pectobacterium odoriferum]|uniref:hypothetical protein n=1 Tax=Pectobacterium odoriferum TaxID=78398 RepID=UPI0004FFA00D|nr:hypothetical protein [Pectobacterium odoriferum]KGA31145.1 hypothetical protein KS43_19595 [Pectobacterium odoriferum]
MKESPIIFNGDMVRAILDGRKTQTRRMVKPTPDYPQILETRRAESGCVFAVHANRHHASEGRFRWDCPFGQPGDRLWVREAFRVMGKATDVARLMYKASERNSFTESTRTVPVDVCTKQSSQKWTPSIHMPRWASRITLEITDVRVERLKHIPRDGMIAEGYPAERAADGGEYDPFLWYRDLWESIYGVGSWQTNPWIWVIEFKRMEVNCNE